MSAESFIFVMQSHSTSLRRSVTFCCLLKVLSMLVRNHSLVYPAVKVYLCLSSCKKASQEKHISDITNSYWF